MNEDPLFNFNKTYCSYSIVLNDHNNISLTCDQKTYREKPHIQNF